MLRTQQFVLTYEPISNILASKSSLVQQIQPGLNHINRKFVTGAQSSHCAALPEKRTKWVCLVSTPGWSRYIDAPPDCLRGSWLCIVVLCFTDDKITGFTWPCGHHRRRRSRSPSRSAAAGPARLLCRRPSSGRRLPCSLARSAAGGAARPGGSPCGAAGVVGSGAPSTSFFTLGETAADRGRPPAARSTAWVTPP